MRIFINGIGSVSAQQLNPSTGEFRFSTQSGNRFLCQEPDYKEMVPAMQLRRMSKVVRLGVWSAKQALRDAGLERPDIITLGTAYGCLADTENFLGKMLTQEETMLTPTAFIQSTHNTVSGQIALMTQCYGHNFTFVHRGHSFETSLQEAMMWLNEQEANTNFTVLTGGIDELTNDSFNIINRFGTYKREDELFEDNTDGCMAGEGANLFVLSQQQNEHSYAELMDVCLCRNANITDELIHFLSDNHLSPDDIDTCLIGLNGDQRYDHIIRSNTVALKNAQFIPFKKWSGEYPTANAFAMTLACTMLKHQNMAKELNTNEAMTSGIEPKNVLIHNHYKNQFHSFILLKRI